MENSMPIVTPCPMKGRRASMERRQEVTSRLETVEDRTLATG